MRDKIAYSLLFAIILSTIACIPDETGPSPTGPTAITPAATPSDRPDLDARPFCESPCMVLKEVPHPDTNTGDDAILVSMPDGHVLLLGGNPTGRASSARVLSFDMETQTWSETTPMPTPRQFMSAIAVGHDKLLVIEGYEKKLNGEYTFADTAFVFDGKTETWEEKEMPSNYSSSASVPAKAVDLGDGRVLMVYTRGFIDEPGEFLWAIYDTALGVWTEEGMFADDFESTFSNVVRVEDGTILIATYSGVHIVSSEMEQVESNPLLFGRDSRDAIAAIPGTNEVVGIGKCSFEAGRCETQVLNLDSLTSERGAPFTYGRTNNPGWLGFVTLPGGTLLAIPEGHHRDVEGWPVFDPTERVWSELELPREVNADKMAPLPGGAMLINSNYAHILTLR